ncbi:MAG: gamma-glutamyltransferase family protein [Pseudomonadales bacterium]|nr:gamma-glutamyltransferase family protein [Pseudomonadales bacterium]
MLNWDCPYPSSRSPVFARNMVATSQPLAVNAGLDALHAGGNAVDAALAAAITLTVVEPNNNGIGSDAFAIIQDGNSLFGLNASGRAPLAWSPEYFKGLSQMPQLGWDAVTVPGAVSAWVAMSERFGRLPFEKLFEAAIGYARDGFPVGPKSAYFFDLTSQFLPSGFESFAHTFFPGGKVPGPGSMLRLPDHAESLAKIAASRGEAFYRGELARAMIADAEAHGGAMSLEDLDRHQCTWVDTISRSFAGVELHEIPPNGQGLLALIATAIVDHLDIGQYPLDSADSVHLQIEATRIAWAEMERHLADPDFMEIPPETFLSDNYAARRAAEIDIRRANPAPSALDASPDTVYLCTADASGMMVSMIQSNYRGFGSGSVVPGTGISLQNRGSGFTLEDGHPNQVAGGKRPFHTIIPGFVTQRDVARMAFGVMGGHMQAQGHLQMMVRIFSHGQNPQAASDAPRWHLREDGVVCLEDGFDPEVARDLESRGHEVVFGNPEHLFGGAQLIYRMDDGYCGGSDHRKEGLAAGF